MSESASNGKNSEPTTETLQGSVKHIASGRRTKMSDDEEEKSTDEHCVRQKVGDD